MDGRVVLYSLGRDRKDDGGKIDLPLGTEGSDIGFRLLEATRRVHARKGP